MVLFTVTTNYSKILTYHRGMLEVESNLVLFTVTRDTYASYTGNVISKIQILYLVPFTVLLSIYASQLPQKSSCTFLTYFLTQNPMQKIQIVILLIKRNLQTLQAHYNVSTAW
jgi:hypothetical protein